METQRIKTLIVCFKNQIEHREISKFRGAVNTAILSKDVLFHNHAGDGFRYAYPLIQYKRIGGRAAIVCLEEGTERIGEVFSGFRNDLQLGNQEINLELDTVKAEQTLVQVWNSEFNYSIRKWLPFNQENYEKFRQIEDLKSKCEFLERILTGNILSFAKGVGVHFEQEVKCSIKNMEEKELMKFKNINFTSFDAQFGVNVSLPNFIGLGKGASHGFGTCVKINYFM